MRPSDFWVAERVWYGTMPGTFLGVSGNGKLTSMQGVAGAPIYSREGPTQYPYSRAVSQRRVFSDIQGLRGTQRGSERFSDPLLCHGSNLIWLLLALSTASYIM